MHAHIIKLATVFNIEFMNCHLNLYIQISTVGYTNFVRKSKILDSTVKR